MYRYHGYGLTVETPIPLPAFGPTESDGSPDLTFREVHFDCIQKRMDQEKAGRDACLVGVYADVCYYAVLDGRTVEVWRFPGVEDGPLARALISQPIAVALRQRGLLALHGCAVGIGDVAVGFMGPSGAGKSTLAEAFFQRGFPILCDDLLALRFEADAPYVEPGHTEIRLRPQAGAALLDGFDDLPTAHSVTGQRFRDVSALPRRALPLKTLYLIDTPSTDDPRMVPVPGLEAYATLATQTWAFQRFRKPAEAALHQAHLGVLVRGGYVVRAERTRSFEALGPFVDLVAEQVARAGSAPATPSLTR